MVKRLVMLGVLPLVGSLGLMACSSANVFQSPESRASEQAYSTARVETVVFAGTQVGTVVALQQTADHAIPMQTQLAQLQLENQVLQGTVEAVLTFGAPVVPRYTPTPARVLQADSPGRLSENFAELQTSLTIDSATGCGIDKRGRFAVTSNVIYMTTIAQNVEAGARHTTRWYFGNDLRFTSSPWVADRSYEAVCIYFTLQSGSTIFEEGLWSVELYLNDEFIVSIPFEMCIEGALC